MSDTEIEDVTAWEVLDSRGNPTVACAVRLAGGATGSAAVPSGASTGRHEAHELRDGDPERYGGRGVRRAVHHVVTELAPAVRGLDAGDQSAVDGLLRELDGTADLSRLGANAVLAVSVATAVAHAATVRSPLYRTAGDGAPLLPLPMVNIVSGGAHAGRAVDIQDVLAVPVGARSFSEAMEWAWRVRAGTVEVGRERGLAVDLVADEGGLGPALAGNRDALALVVDGIHRAGLRPGDDVALAVDVAASQFRTDDGAYRFAAEQRSLTAAELIAELVSWTAEFPVVSLEDVLGEDDWTEWAVATQALDEIQLLGDDLFVTDAGRLARGIESGVGNAILVKPNQAGTLSDALGVVGLARSAGYRTVLSARSGETEDSWLADLAVGWRTGQLKVGSLTRSERTAKWNRLLAIEHELGSAASYAGPAALRP